MNHAEKTAMEVEIKVFMDIYLRAFEEMSISDAAACYFLPVILSTSQGFQVIAETAGVHAFLDTAFKGMKAQKYERSEWAKMKIHMLHNRGAIVSTVVRRYDSHGQVILNSGATYILLKDDRWKITQAIPHDESMILV